MTGYEADCILFLLYIMITHITIKMTISIAILIPTVTPITILLVVVVDMLDMVDVVVDNTIVEAIDVSLVDDTAVDKLIKHTDAIRRHNICAPY